MERSNNASEMVCKIYLTAKLPMCDNDVGIHCGIMKAFVFMQIDRQSPTAIPAGGAAQQGAFTNKEAFPWPSLPLLNLI
jgi:hypothetical protein